MDQILTERLTILSRFLVDSLRAGVQFSGDSIKAMLQEALKDIRANPTGDPSFYVARSSDLVERLHRNPSEQNIKSLELLMGYYTEAIRTKAIVEPRGAAPKKDPNAGNMKAWHADEIHRRTQDCLFKPGTERLRILKQQLGQYREWVINNQSTNHR